MTQKLPSISSLDLFGRKRERDRDRARDRDHHSPPPTLFQFPSELLPSSSFRHPYITNSQSDPLIAANSSTSAASTSSSLSSKKRLPSSNSGAINQRNHVKAKNLHSNILVKCIELLHQRCDPSITPDLPPNWQQRNDSSVKDKLSAVKDLYFSLTGEQWVDE